MAIEILSTGEIPQEAAALIAKTKTRLPDLPFDSLDAWQSIRIPFADLAGHDIATAANAIRVRAHRATRRIGWHFHVHQAEDAFYVTKGHKA
jgi:hypothetical protein